VIARSPARTHSSGGRGGGGPRLVSRGSELPEGRSADQVGLGVEGVVDGGVCGQEPLGGALALEPLLFSLPSSDDQVRVLHPVVVTQSARPVAVPAAQLPQGGAI